MNPPSLRRVSGRRLQLGPDSDGLSSGGFSFIVMADPQLGLLERYIEKRSEPYHWDRDLHSVDRAIAVINQISPKPTFVIGCGDLVDGQPGHKYREYQTRDLLGSFSLLDRSIQLISLPGNHDIGDSPSRSDLADYRGTWGDDYYSFETHGVDFLVLNSQLLWNDSNCRDERVKFDSWFQSEVTRMKHSTHQIKIAFQHIPFFIAQPDEEDDYFNIPLKHRIFYLRALYEAGVRYVFTGHLHRNVCTTWIPPDCRPDSEPLHLVSSSSVSVQLGPDKSGIRLVCVSPDSGLRHIYYSLDQLETMLAKGEQPQVST
ncbi:Serine/threonine-protein phosphatase CPPED1 [Fasciola hepatica]|uniref:Serine/threonine-protein phosphatase CPPED1 n=1 Tax=Fasciola hepatica TaxID=6192 RepID=A0A2H1CAG9_FASHE|nr:Serine/threonine-protein phosphatase CPPED1 [Fasciola hepatica]